MTKGILLLAIYSMGLAVPFLLTSLGIERFLKFYKPLPHAHACAGSGQRRVADRARNFAGGWTVHHHLELFVVPEPVRSLDS